MIYSELHEKRVSEGGRDWTLVSFFLSSFCFNFFLSRHETFRVCYTFDIDVPHFLSFTTGRRVHEHTNLSPWGLCVLFTPYLSKTHVHSSYATINTFLDFGLSPFQVFVTYIQWLVRIIIFCNEADSASDGPPPEHICFQTSRRSKWMARSRTMRCEKYLCKFLFQIFLLHYVQVCFHK